jgi:hypothetical protein
VSAGVSSDVAHPPPKHCHYRQVARDYHRAIFNILNFRRTTKAVQQLKKPEPEKARVKTYLDKAKNLMKGLLGMAGGIVAIDKALEVLDKLF